MKKLIALILFFFIFALNVFAQENSIKTFNAIGRVQNLEYVDLPDIDENQVKQEVEIKILNSDLKNKLVVVDNMLTGNPHYDILLKKGMKVQLHIELDTEDYEILSISIENVHRTHLLWGLSFIFVILLLYVGKNKGVFSLISIILTCLFIIYFLSPMILFGFNPIIATILVSILSTAITMYLVGGLNKKSSSAVLGCIFSLFFAGVLSFLTVKLASLNGVVDEESLFLYATYPQLDFRALIVSSMILATLGAVMDVAMSIASTVNEIYFLDNSKSVKELFTSGMNVGRDIIGTMANTLILVYLGASLPLLLLANNIDLQKFLNLNQVVVEISSALIGSSAIIICVPLTAIISANLIKKTSEEFSIKSIDD